MPAMSYTFDPLGRRALKPVGSLKTSSIYEGWQCVNQKVTGSGTDGKWLTVDDVSATISEKGSALTFQGRELDVETGRIVSDDPFGVDGENRVSKHSFLYAKDGLRLAAGVPGAGDYQYWSDPSDPIFQHHIRR